MCYTVTGFEQAADVMPRRCAKSNLLEPGLGVTSNRNLRTILCCVEARGPLSRLSDANGRAIIAALPLKSLSPDCFPDMFLRARARRFAAAVRRAVLGPPLLRLIRLLRRGQNSGDEYADLCLQLGLATRAIAALRDTPPLTNHPSLRVRLAALTGDTDGAIGQARELAARLPDDTLSWRELASVVNCVMPLSPEGAMALIEAGGRPNLAEPALRLRMGDIDGCERSLERLGARLGPQRWLLWANLQNDSVRRLDGLNRFLAAHGMAPVCLRDSTRQLSVGNLDARVSQRRGFRSGAKLSVVMTCYDCAPYVHAAIRSVLGQTHRELELIAIDDGSNDDTWRHLQSAAEADSRLRPLRLRRNIGTYAAKNVGLSIATGDYLAFQDADDWSYPERFARSLELLHKRPWLQAVSCEYVRLQDDGSFWSGVVWPLQRRTPNSVLFRRRGFERIGFLDEHRFGSDSEYVARLQVAFGPQAIHRLAQPLIMAAQRQHSLMTTPSTGLDANGRSQVRVDYQERWTEALLRCALAGESLYRFAQPETLEMSVESLTRRS